MNDRRSSVDEYLMGLARAAAARSTCTKTHATGAVASIDGRVVMTGYNGVPARTRHCDEGGCVRLEDGKHAYLVHAEENIVAQAARFGVQLAGATVHCTHMPCSHCFAVLMQAGVSTVVYERAALSETERQFTEHLSRRGLTRLVPIVERLPHREALPVVKKEVTRENSS